MGTSTRRPGLNWFVRYDEPTEFKKWHAMALASILPPSEEYVLAIDCADRWLFRWWGTKLVLTNERVVAFRADPNDPMKRTYWIADIHDVKYDPSGLVGEMRLLGADLYDSYAVPKRLGREFAEAVRTRVG